MKQLFLIIVLFVFIKSSAQSFSAFNEIGQTTLQFEDESRNRILITEVWYPTTDSLTLADKKTSPFKRLFTVEDGKLASGKFPLIMMSHGTGGNRLNLEWLAQALVQNGFIVAAVDHWGNTFDNKIPIEFVKPWERPLDMSYVLSELLKSETFGRAISKEEIGALGFSFGGYTVLALAGAELDYQILLDYYNTPEGRKEVELPELPELAELLSNSKLFFMESIAHIPKLKDVRFKAFLAISPGTSRGFVSEKQFEEVNDPVFIMGCEADEITPVESYSRHYHKLIPHSEYYEFSGETGHYVMLPEATKEVKQKEPLIFIDHPSVDRQEIHRKTQQLCVEFFNKSLIFKH